MGTHLNHFCIGGGFALSDATQASGLSDWIGQQLIVLKVLPPFVIMLIICIITATITEIASNTATANILLPILADTVLLIDLYNKSVITNLSLYSERCRDILKYSRFLSIMYCSSCRLFLFYVGRIDRGQSSLLNGASNSNLVTFEIYMILSPPKKTINHIYWSIVLMHSCFR